MFDDSEKTDAPAEDRGVSLRGQGETRVAVGRHSRVQGRGMNSTHDRFGMGSCPPHARGGEGWRLFDSSTEAHPDEQALSKSGKAVG